MDQEPAVVKGLPLENTSPTVLPAARKGDVGAQPSKMLTQLRSEIEGIRSDLDIYVTELDRRRHEVLDIQSSARKHKGLIIAVGASLVALTVGLVIYRTKSRAKRSPGHFRDQRAGMRPSARILGTDESFARRVAEAAVGIAVGAVIGAVKGRVQRAVSGQNPASAIHER